MTKFKAGDKVRVLDKSEILFGFDLTNGKEYEVTEIHEIGVSVFDDADDKLTILESEFHAIELVKEGCAHTPSTHNESLVLTRLFNAEAEVDRMSRSIDELKRRIETLETKTYTANITINKGAETFDKEKFADELAKALGVIRKPKTPTRTSNQRRADVIKRAEAFVEDLEGRARSGYYNAEGNRYFNSGLINTDFHVNEEKGVVTALAKGLNTGRLYHKAFARCAPGDVFNASIGKAIAAGRLYGVTIPQEFLDAPQPTEPVVGMRVETYLCNGRFYNTIQPAKVEDGYEMYDSDTDSEFTPYEPEYGDAIIVDSEAVYE